MVSSALESRNQELHNAVLNTQHRPMGVPENWFIVWEFGGRWRWPPAGIQILALEVAIFKDRLQIPLKLWYQSNVANGSIPWTDDEGAGAHSIHRDRLLGQLTRLLNLGTF